MSYRTDVNGGERNADFIHEELRRFGYCPTYWLHRMRRTNSGGRTRRSAVARISCVSSGWLNATRGSENAFNGMLTCTTVSRRLRGQPSQRCASHAAGDLAES